MDLFLQDMATRLLIFVKKIAVCGAEAGILRQKPSIHPEQDIMPLVLPYDWRQER